MLKDRMAEIPKLMKTIKPQIQEIAPTLSRTDKWYRKHHGTPAEDQTEEAPQPGGSHAALLGRTADATKRRQLAMGRVSPQRRKPHSFPGRNTLQRVRQEQGLFR